MKKIDLRKENKKEEVINFEDVLHNDEWGQAYLTSEHWQNVKILPLGSRTHDYYLAQDKYGMMALYRCRK